MNAPLSLATPQRAKLRVSDFLLLADSGAFVDYARTELIEGEIWVVSAIHSPHARAHSLFNGELFVALRAMDSPLVLYTIPSTELSDDSVPEPDIAVAEPNDQKTLPGKKLRIAIEISDASLEIDLGRKMRLYARYAVPEYWVVDVEGGVTHQMWAPVDGAYSRRQNIMLGGQITAATIAGLRIATTRF